MRHKFEIEKEKNRVMEQKLLQEVGGDQSNSERMDKIMDDGWKGRSQQIVMLKTKMKRMEANAKTGGMMDQKAAHSGQKGATAQQRVAANNLRRDVDFKAQQEINEMERERQRGIEELSKAYVGPSLSKSTATYLSLLTRANAGTRK
jgi:hypothetical protein